jgi:hypothetical protein
MPRQIRFILTLILGILFFIPSSVFACSMSLNPESNITIQTTIKPQYLNQTESCLEASCVIKITKLDKSETQNYSKDDFIIVKKLNTPLEVDYFGQKKTISEKSFKIQIQNDRIIVKFTSAEVQLSKTGHIESQEVKEIVQKIVVDDVSSVEFNRFKLINPGLLGSTDTNSATFYKFSNEKQEELEDQKNHPKGLECRYTEFELKSGWIKTWGEYRSYCKEAGHGIRCNRFVHPDDFEAQQEGFHIIGGKYNAFNPTNPEQAKSAMNYYQTSTTSEIKSFWFLFGNWIVLVFLICVASASVWFYRRKKVKKSNLSQKK